jgi:CRP/FNR family transcriptional regulator
MSISSIRASSLAPRAPLRLIGGLENPCSDYALYELSDGLEPDGLRQLDSVVRRSARFKKGETLYQAGDPFSALYAIQLGSCKTTVLVEDGRDQIIGYHMLGDIIGVEGISTGRHVCDAVALEESTVCALPFTRLERIARTNTVLQHNLHQLLARDIARDQFMLLLLGSMRAEERLAVFLLDLSERYHQRGYSSTEFVLRMTRQEIGSYLGIKLETVSRVFSRFQEEGLLQVQGREVKLVALSALKQLAGRRCRDAAASRALPLPPPAQH